MERTASRRLSSFVDLDVALGKGVTDVDFKLDDKDLELAIKVCLCSCTVRASVCACSCVSAVMVCVLRMRFLCGSNRRGFLCVCVCVCVRACMGVKVCMPFLGLCLRPSVCSCYHCVCTCGLSTRPCVII